MKKFISFILLLVFLIATTYGQSTPSLEDTLAWMKRYIDLYGVYTDEASISHATFIYKTGDNQITIMGTRYSNYSEFTTVFQLNDLDSEVLNIVLLKRGYYRLWFLTNESEDLIKITAKQVQGSDRGTMKIYYENSDYLDFKDKSIAERVLTAFKNAILSAKEKEIF